MACHAKRGKGAFQEHASCRALQARWIHDGCKPYRALDCSHGLCHVHHLRELTFLHEQLKQDWAADMAALRHTEPAYVQAVQDLRSLYGAILDQSNQASPLRAPSEKRGGTKQSLAANLLRRLRLYGDDVWSFMTDPGVPFTNNLAEQAVRMPKIKQKVSGCFRTSAGAQTFCVIRFYLATMHKQGAIFLIA